MATTVLLLWGLLAPAETPATLDAPAPLSAPTQVFREGTQAHKGADTVDTLDAEAAAAERPPVRRPQRWLTLPWVPMLQVLAGAGVIHIMAPLVAVPGLNLVAIPVMLVAQGAAVVWAGDRLGNGRAALVWPLVTVALVGGAGAVCAAVASAGTVALSVYALQLQLRLTPENLGGLWWVSLVLLAVSFGLQGLAGVGVALTAASPVAATLVYQATKRTKSPDDNGADLPGLLHPGGPAPPAPRGDEPADEASPDSDGDNDPDTDAEESSRAPPDVARQARG